MIPRTLNNSIKLILLGLIGWVLSDQYGEAANLYDFSYTFANDATVTGVLEGTTDSTNANIVDVSSVLSMSFDGTPVSGPITAGSWNSPVAEISSNVDLNALHFYNTGYSAEFLTQQDDNYNGTFFEEQDLAGGYVNGTSTYVLLGEDAPMIQNNWIFTEVPEPSNSNLLVVALACLSGTSTAIKRLFWKSSGANASG
jgi:hypothetical protein